MTSEDTPKPNVPDGLQPLTPEEWEDLRYYGEVRAEYIETFPRLKELLLRAQHADHKSVSYLAELAGYARVEELRTLLRIYRNKRAAGMPPAAPWKWRPREEDGE